MLTDASVLELSTQGLLAEVVGYETDEIALSAQGASIVTYRGAQYLDFTGGIAVHACGHSHPAVVAAIIQQAQQVMHVSDTMRHAPQLELGQWMRERLGSVLPGSPWSFLFLNSGSESIDAAAKLALKVTGRSRFIAFEGAFHGRTLFATALSRSKKRHWQAYEGFLEPLRAHIHHAPAPRSDSGNGERAICDISGFERLVKRIGNDVAAVFFEPIQGEGGYVPFAPEAMQRIRELTKRHGILLIADEIQTGWGRTGRWFGFENLGVAPDVLVFGKAVGGGLPLAGVAAPESLFAQWEPGEHGTTFGGNPVACAAGLAALKVIARAGLVARAAERGAQIKARLRPLIGSHGVVDVRGYGLMIGVELRTAAGKPDYAGCDAVKRRARENGLLLLTCGAKLGHPAVDNATLRLIPPLNVSDDVLERGLGLFESALQQVTAKAA